MRRVIRRRSRATSQKPLCYQDGVTGRQPAVVALAAVPQSDGVKKRSQAQPAPSIIEERPWSIMPVSTSHWKARAYAL